MSQNAANAAPKISRAKVQTQAAWLTRPVKDGGAGLTYAQLGLYLGRSAGWAHHIAHGNWAAVSLSAETARIVAAVYHIERARWRDSVAQVRAVQDLLAAAGDVVARIEKLSRTIVRR